MPTKEPFARIAITLPPETLRAADELAARHDRSRSWIVAEAIRQYAASQRGETREEGVSKRLGRSRLEQLRRDVALSPEARVLESEEVAAVGGGVAKPTLPHSFRSYDDFLAWRRQREAR